MGAGQSSTRGDSRGQSNTGSGHVKTCYYELLGVDRQANDDEIKKAYRKRALELHPDRNYGDAENSTRLFAEVQSAHQVLSDPHERAWYDSHRDAILRDVDIGSNEQFEDNVQLTSAAQLMSLMGKFTTNIPFTDSSNGFYGSLRTTFATLAEEENAACSWEGLDQVQYPDFGTSQDSYELTVKPFYAAWNGFATRKTFSWKDVHNYADAPDRRIRRLMEKENKHLREEAIREFNDAVRSLVGFVRKRDPRYAPYVQSEAQRQESLRAAAAAQASRARALHQAKFDEHVQPAWAEAGRTEEEGSFSQSEQSEAEEFECVTCNKTFKSEKQYEAHEKSKKHIKAVQQLVRQMKKENKLFDLDHSLGKPAPNPAVENDSDEALGTVEEKEPSISQSESMTANTSSQPTHEADTEEIPHEETQSNSPAFAEDDMPNDTDDDEYAPRDVVEERMMGDETIQSDTQTLSAGLDTMSLSNNDNADVGDTQEESPIKHGKAKAKKARRAVREATNNTEQSLTCVACNQSFGSKTKLFNHINKEKHAQPVPERSAAVDRKGKRSRA